ncbi:MAG: HAMP domain-containing histidine kinase [Actinomycetota bacterium]|nr:HAMP domain-containing histidine kinase [Actinomycetota bacterium]
MADQTAGAAATASARAQRSSDGSQTRLARSRRIERVMQRIRVVGIAFGVVQVLTYYLPYPPGILPAAFGLLGLLAAGTAAVQLALQRITSLRAVRRLGACSLLLDIVVVTGLVFVYTFDPDTAIWALLYILPLEGAIRFGLRGALMTMAIVAAVYAVREVFGAAAYGNAVLATSISFRMGVGFIIAAVAGAMASNLVTERDQVERARAELEAYATELAAANAELQAANEVTQDFLAMTNHELRTPLTTIMGYTSLLSDRWDALPDDSRRRFVGMIERQSSRLHSLVQDLLTLSSARAGKLAMVLEPVELAAAVDDAIANNGPTAADVRNTCPKGLWVTADSDRLCQILVNYVSNALRYGTPPVTVVATVEQGWAQVCVDDAGAGVAEEFVPHLFEKFARSGRAKTRHVDGTGLGLAIVRQLARAQGGDAWYEPNQPNGSRFCLRLPLAQTPDRP